MKKIIVSLSVSLMLFCLTAGLAMSQSKETRDVSGFRDVNFGISGNLYITIGSTYKLTLEGDADYLREIETVVKDGKLQIRRDNYRMFNNERANVYITMPSISGLGVSGSGTAKIESTVEADAFNLSVSGSGKVYLADFSADSFGCSISGSGDVIIQGKGSADEGKITISGSGNYAGADFEIDKLSVNISGSGRCDCKAGDSLTARISGSGNVYYSGQPRLDVRASGSGHVRSK
jgi:Putative auto-transporter adhesin, head GIN domain